MNKYAVLGLWLVCLNRVLSLVSEIESNDQYEVGELKNWKSVVVDRFMLVC